MLRMVHRQQLNTINILIANRGPETGRLVLFVHGISTPSLALYRLADSLVTNHSCRVLLVDLWGRGYSDAPTDLPCDARLYTTQLLLALTSSPIPWTGSSTGAGAGFDVVGYSLGGGIAANFAAHFPRLVRSLILLTPAGLIRRNRRNWAMWFLYGSRLFPEFVLAWFIRWSLAGLVRAPTGSGARQSMTAAQAQNSNTGLPLVSSTPSARELPTRNVDDAEDPLVPKYPHLDIASAVSWQVATHRGFAHAFLASIRDAPSVEQGDIWRRIPSARPGAQGEGEGGEGGRKPKVLILAGARDPLIHADELRVDAKEVLGEEVEFRVLDAGHELPVSCWELAVEIISGFWGVSL